jgi:hypothetical protein
LRRPTITGMEHRDRHGAADRRLAAASDEIRDAIVRAHPGGDERPRLERLMRLTDRLLDEVEQLNLDEACRLSPDWTARLDLLFSSLPFAFEPVIDASPTPTDVLDVIFDLQQAILARKTGAPLERLADDDGVGEPRPIAC